MDSKKIDKNNKFKILTINSKHKFKEINLPPTSLYNYHFPISLLYKYSKQNLYTIGVLYNNPKKNQIYESDDIQIGITGSVKIGETLKDAAIREVAEETGIDISSSKPQQQIVKIKKIKWKLFKNNLNFFLINSKKIIKKIIAIQKSVVF